jgi:ketosteroid isomerase-like protein
LTPLEAMRAAFAAWEQRDPAALAALFAPDGVFIDPLKPGILTGPAEIEAGNRDAMAAVEDVRVTIEVGFENDVHAAAEGKFLARIAGTDERFDFGYMASLELRHGRIARLTEYFDTRPLTP